MRFASILIKVVITRNISLIIVFLILQGCGKSLENKIRDDFCDCLSTLSLRDKEEKGAETCFQDMLETHEKEILTYLSTEAIKEIDLTDPNAEEKAYNMGYDFVGDILDKNQLYFFENCGQYFEKVNTARREGYATLFQKCDPERLARWDTIIEELSLNSEFLKKRGMCHAAEGRFELALADAEEILAKSSGDRQGIFS